jgi:hypothetical protein
MEGVINPEYSRVGKPIHRGEKPFMFLTYVVGGMLIGLLLMVYAIFSLLVHWK